MVKVIILAGGYGTRLSEETAVLPKPMIEIGGYPLLWHILKGFSSQGFNDFTIALGYKAEIIKQYFTQLSQIEANLRIDLEAGSVSNLTNINEKWKIDLIHTGLNTMTGGRLKQLKDSVDGPVIFTYGDGLSDVDVNKLLSFHKSHGKLATVTATQPQERFGVLKLNDDQVVQFNEKKNNSKSWINGGYFVLEKAALDYIEGDSTSWEREPCENLTRDGQLMAFKHEGYWQCVDTLHELRLLRDLWNRDEAPWKIWD